MLRFNGSKIWPNFVLVLSISCLCAVLVAVVGVRGEFFGFRTAVGILRHAMEVACVTVLAIIVVFAFYAPSRKKSIVSFLIVLIPITGILVAQPKSEPTPDAVKGKRPAPLNDVSTDVINPPLYDAVASLRSEKSNTLVYPGEKAAALQRKRFPSISPIYTDLSTDDAFTLAMAIVKDTGWELVLSDNETGVIEAVASTLVFNFKDDVIIRIAKNDAGSVVDIRSHSRVGRGDMNANGNRIINFMTEFNKRTTEQ